MTTKQKINMLLGYAGISQAELARRLNCSPANFNQKLKRGTLVIEDYEKIAKALNVKWIAYFELDNGIKI